LSEDAAGAYLGVNTHSQEAPPNMVAPSAGGPRGGRSATPEVTLVITSITPGSPSASAGLEAGDQILEVEGVKATPKAINDLLAVSQPAGRGGRGQVELPASQPIVMPKKPGEKIMIRISRNGATQNVEVELGRNRKRTFSFHPLSNPTPLQTAIWQDWLRPVQ
jgi:PDZ domain